jgi:hypothetical protein
VIVAVAVEDLPLLAAVHLVGDLADHLEGLLVGLAPAVGVVDAAQARHLLDQALAEACVGDGARGAGEEREAHELVAHGVGHPLAPVADVDGPDAARDGVDVLLAGDVPDAHPAAFDDDPRVHRLEGLVLDEVVPNVRAVGLDNGAGVVDAVGVVERVHGTEPSRRGGLRGILPAELAPFNPAAVRARRGTASCAGARTRHGVRASRRTSETVAFSRGRAFPTSGQPCSSLE